MQPAINGPISRFTYIRQSKLAHRRPDALFLSSCLREAALIFPKADKVHRKAENILITCICQRKWDGQFADCITCVTTCVFSRVCFPLSHEPFNAQTIFFACSPIEC